VDIKLTTFRLIIYVIACEALVHLWFNAAPLQPVRRFFIKITPFFTSKEQGNLFECKYCVSVWIGFILVALLFVRSIYLELLMISLVIHRLSNFLHLIMSFIRDKQFDIRINRNRR